METVVAALLIAAMVGLGFVVFNLVLAAEERQRAQRRGHGFGMLFRARPFPGCWMVVDASHNTFSTQDHAEAKRVADTWRHQGRTDVEIVPAGTEPGQRGQG